MHSVKSVALLILLMLILPSMAIARDVTLAWDPNTDTNVVGYRLYARESGEAYDYSDYEWYGNTAQCTVTGFDEYESYYFVIRAYDRDGNESGDSNEVYLAAIQGEDENDSSDSNDSSDNALESGDGSKSTPSGGGSCFISSLFGR